MSGGFGNLIRRDAAKFKKKIFSNVGDWKCVISSKYHSSIVLKLEITVLFGIPRGLSDFSNSLGLPIVSESFLQKKKKKMHRF